MLKSHLLSVFFIPPNKIAQANDPPILFYGLPLQLPQPLNKNRLLCAAQLDTAHFLLPTLITGYIFPGGLNSNPMNKRPNRSDMVIPPKNLVLSIV